MDRFIYKGKCVAIRIRIIKSGSLPVTDSKEALQVVTLKHPKGAYLKAHTHVPKPRRTSRLQECIILRKGRVRVDLYGEDGACFRRVMLRAGEALLLLRGGYGIHVLQNAEMFEFKNGPFIEDKKLL